MVKWRRCTDLEARCHVTVRADVVGVGPCARSRSAVAGAPVQVHVEHCLRGVESAIHRIVRVTLRGGIVGDADGGGVYENVSRNVNPVQYGPAPTSTIVVVVIQGVSRRQIDTIRGKLTGCKLDCRGVVVITVMEIHGVVYQRIQVVKGQPLFSVAVGVPAIVGSHSGRRSEVRTVTGMVSCASRH